MAKIYQLSDGEVAFIQGGDACCGNDANCVCMDKYDAARLIALKYAGYFFTCGGLITLGGLMVYVVGQYVFRKAHSV